MAWAKNKFMPAFGCITFPKLTHGPDRHSHESKTFSLSRLHHAMAAFERGNLQTVDALVYQVNSKVWLERSHLCGNDICEILFHSTYESHITNVDRAGCHAGRHLCRHLPRCLLNPGFEFVPVVAGKKATDPTAAGVWVDPRGMDRSKVFDLPFTQRSSLIL